MHGVKPENYQEHKSLVKQAEEFGEAAVEFCKHLQKKNKSRKREKKPRPVIEKVVCKFCQVEHNDTEGGRRKHERTVRHRLAVELYEAHAKSLGECNTEEKNEI